MRSLSPLPSGYVRPSRRRAPFAGLTGPTRFVAEGLAVLLGQVARLGRALARGWAQRRERARTLDQLAALSDHVLKDVGLERRSLQSAVIDIERGVDPRRR